jgi:Mn2+/Fe2+ NRAMP family transporter
MGLAFLVVAVQSSVSLTDAVGHALLPAFPENAALLVIGLVGTTVVPYNLFLASGISRGQDVREMRFGISLAVLIGGVISMAILLAGTQIAGEFSFQALAAALRTGLGEGAGVLFAFGLFAAGASSAVTAPLAAAITGQSLLGGDDKRWSVKSVRFRLVWAMVLGVGLGFGLSEVKPIPAIIAAQAINGVLLPVVAVFLWLAVNDRRLLPERFVNKGGLNVAMGAVVAVAAALGLYNLWKSLVSLTG